MNFIELYFEIWFVGYGEIWYLDIFCIERFDCIVIILLGCVDWFVIFECDVVFNRDGVFFNRVICEDRNLLVWIDGVKSGLDGKVVVRICVYGWIVYIGVEGIIFICDGSIWRFSIVLSSGYRS